MPKGVRYLILLGEMPTARARQAASFVFGEHIDIFLLAKVLSQIPKFPQSPQHDGHWKWYRMYCPSDDLLPHVCHSARLSRSRFAPVWQPFPAVCPQGWRYRLLNFLQYRPLASWQIVARLNHPYRRTRCKVLPYLLHAVSVSRSFLIRHSPKANTSKAFIRAWRLVSRLVSKNGIDQVKFLSLEKEAWR